MIKELTEQNIAGLVQQFLNRHQYDGVEIGVVEEGIRREGNRWHIPVRSHETTRTYRYYEELVEVEDELMEQERVEVLLIPAG